MATQAHVNPGDLIRADLINDLLDRVAALEAAQSTSSPPPSSDVVLSQVPSTVRVGDPMTIVGENFGHSTGATVVTFDNHLITSFVSASDTQLVFVVPDTSTISNPIPALGRTMVVSVSNATSTKTATTLVLPRVVTVQGDIEVRYVGTDPATPVTGSFFVEYSLESHASLEVDTTITPSVSTGWTPLNVRLTETSAPLATPATISLPAHGTQTFVVEVTVPGSAAAGTTFDVDLHAAGGGLSADAPQQHFTVGTAAGQEATYIDVSAPGGTSISVAAGDSTTVNLDCEFTETGNYDFSATFPDGASGWTLDLSDVPTPIEVPTLPGSGTAGVAIDIGVTAPGAATDPVTLMVYVQKEGETIGFHLPLTLNVS